jgi:hypothetical protein
VAVSLPIVSTTLTTIKTVNAATLALAFSFVLGALDSAQSKLTPKADASTI